MGLPGVGAKLALRLLYNFESVTGVFSAGFKDLIQVGGIGPEKARRIRSVLEAVVKDGRREASGSPLKGG